MEDAGVMVDSVEEFEGCATTSDTRRSMATRNTIRNLEPLQINLECSIALYEQEGCQ
jgi:hypothetical protein